MATDPRSDLNEQTLAEAQAAIAMGDVARRRTSSARAPYAGGIELEYGSALVNIVDGALEALSPLIAVLPALLDRADQEAARQVRQHTAAAYRVFAAAVTDDFMQRIARSIAQRLIVWERQTFQKQFAAATGAIVPTLGTGPGVAAVIDAFVLENVSLMKSIAEDLIDQIEKDITREMANRAVVDRADATPKKKPPRTAKGIVEARTKQAKKRARLTARDQIGKTGGRAAARMQQEAGIKKFRWRSRRDDRVRPLHRKLDGKLYKYPKGHPTEGMPGQPHGCRCFPEPDFEGGVVLAIGRRNLETPSRSARRRK